MKLSVLSRLWPCGYYVSQSSFPVVAFFDYVDLFPSTGEIMGLEGGLHLWTGARIQGVPEMRMAASAHPVSCSSIGREQSSEGKFFDSPGRLRHGVGSQHGNIHPLDSNRLHIHDTNETEDLTQIRLDKIPRAPWAFRKNAARS